MHRAFKAGAVVASALAAGALIMPQLASGNARLATATPAELALVRPLTALLKGSTTETPPGDPDGIGGAAVTIDNSTATPDVCFDLSASNIDTPILSHIHKGVAGTNGPIVVDFTPPVSGASSGCAAGAALHPAAGGFATAADLLTDIIAHPEAYYVNVHTAAFPAGAIRGQLSPNAAPAGSIHLLATPLRAYDSRATGGGGPVVGNAAARTISLLTGKDASGADTLAVPPGATGAMLTVTVTDTAGPGFLTVYSAALAQTPGTSNVNYDHAGAIQAVNTTVAVNNLSQIKVFAGSHSTDVVVDVVGYTF